jgi:hypothetical protein
MLILVNKLPRVGLLILTTVTMTITVFWQVTPCSLVQLYLPTF